jgi:PAS domain S-box-containing protein
MSENPSAQVLLESASQPAFSMLDDLPKTAKPSSISTNKNQNTTVIKKTISEEFEQVHEDLEEHRQASAVVLNVINQELHQDFSNRNAAECTVCEEHNRFRIMAETIPYGILECNLNGIITFANTEYHRIHEYPEGSLIGNCIWQILKPIIPNVQQEFEEILQKHSPPKCRYYSMQNPSGKNIDIKVDWNYLSSVQGDITGFIAIITDITKQRQVEAEAQQRLNQLAHVTRIFTMNQMVSGLAHELNQPLTAIANFAQTCLYRLRESSDQYRNILLESIQQISTQADRAGQIIHRMRDFVRPADSGRTLENINNLVDDVLSLLEIDARSRSLQILTFLADDLPLIIVDRIQIEQVITNLVKNAMEATWSLPQQHRRVTLRTEMNSNGMVQVSITDTGKGIKSDDLNRVFEPFYTTKPYGMGLGLSISQSIVDSHGGHLEVVNNIHGETTFRFKLPVVLGGAKK